MGNPKLKQRKKILQVSAASNHFDFYLHEHLRSISYKICEVVSKLAT